MRTPVHLSLSAQVKRCQLTTNSAISHVKLYNRLFQTLLLIEQTQLSLWLQRRSTSIGRNVRLGSFSTKSTFIRIKYREICGQSPLRYLHALKEYLHIRVIFSLKNERLMLLTPVFPEIDRPGGHHSELKCSLRDSQHQDLLLPLILVNFSELKPQL